jgi:hypothetical protein
METQRKLASYILDVWFGARQFPSGWAKPAVVRGYFEEASEEAQLQELFFEALLAQGFRRTPWQLILPEQTAGLIKKVRATPEGGNQYHVRFYSDGTIDCELEAHNFSIHHFSGYRVKDHNLLYQFLEASKLPFEHRQRVQELFGTKTYEKSPIRAKKQSSR